MLASTNQLFLSQQNQSIDQSVDRSKIKYSIGNAVYGRGDGEFTQPHGVAFDTVRGHLLVVDSHNNRIQVFSSCDGTFVCKFGQPGDKPGEFQLPYGIAIDHVHERLLITDDKNWRVQVLSSLDYSVQSCFGSRGFGPKAKRFEFSYIPCLAIDHRNEHVVIVDSNNGRLQVLGLEDLAFSFFIGTKKGRQAVKLSNPVGVAIDHERDRLIVTDCRNNQVQVLAAAKGALVHKFGSAGDQPGQFNGPHGVCVDHQGRIIVADSRNYRLQAFTSEGEYISSFDCGRQSPFGLAYDEQRDLLAFSAGNQVHVIEAAQWLLPRNAAWTLERHQHAPKSVRQVVRTMMMIRSLVPESVVALLSNEMMLVIFSYLDV